MGRPRISNRSDVRSGDEPVGLGGIDPDEQAALAARADRHVPVDEEREPAEHALLGDPAFSGHQLADAIGKMLVERHTRG